MSVGAYPGDATPRRPREGSRPPEAAARTGTRSRPRVLIVDDHQDTREMYAWCMRASGWNVAAVTDGEAAVVAASAFEPDVIVMDLYLPVLDGIAAIRCLREDSRTARIPIVACTAFGRAHEAEARAAGCDEFVAKPCPPDEMCSLLERLVTTGDAH